MTNQQEASRLAREGLESWTSGDLETAEHQFRQALELADPEHWSFPDLHAQLGKVLADLGRDEDALQRFQAALEAELRHYAGQEVSPVRIQRHFLAEQLLKMGRPGDALAAVEDALRMADAEDAVNLLLRIDRVVCLHSVGRYDEARAAAREILSIAPAAKIAYVRDRLDPILDELDSAAD
jgi:tetratricopeptide (TPR) repeat protein